MYVVTKIIITEQYSKTCTMDYCAIANTLGTERLMHVRCVVGRYHWPGAYWRRSNRCTYKRQNVKIKPANYFASLNILSY